MTISSDAAFVEKLQGLVLNSEKGRHNEIRFRTIYIYTF